MSSFLTVEEGEEFLCFFVDLLIHTQFPSFLSFIQRFTNLSILYFLLFCFKCFIDLHLHLHGLVLLQQQIVLAVRASLEPGIYVTLFCPLFSKPSSLGHVAIDASHAGHVGHAGYAVKAGHADYECYAGNEGHASYYIEVCHASNVRYKSQDKPCKKSP